jgi:hypothetical protein
MLCRWLLKRRMRNTKTDKNTREHPATNSVKNHMSGSERCLVVWGLSYSLTISCCQNIANGVFYEKGGAKTFRCDEIARGPAPLKQTFLEVVACKTLDDFVRYLPKADWPVWLIFDAVNRLDADTITFFQDLIQLSYESSKFKLLLFTHKTDIACSVLRWSDTHHPIRIVEPLWCCQWKDQHLNQIVQSDEAAGDLEAQWALGITRLNQFLREEWAQSGAFTVSQERLAVMSSCGC